MKRRILLILAAAGCCAHASVTKVGNGDDGADLEALTPIEDGPIFATRTQALAHLNRLNIDGIPGLGALAPELEHSKLMLAREDVRAKSEVSGAIEVSEGNELIYARTFAVPYAATRFFPASLKLSAQQLVALHIHEALHRSLPENIRENEDVVAHITLAMTSPGATYDRVKQVTGLYIRPLAAAQISAPVQIQFSEVREPSKSKFAYKFESWQNNYGSFYSFAGRTHSLEFATSLGKFRKIGALQVEPNFRARMKMLYALAGIFGDFGSTAYDLSARVVDDDGVINEPFVRFAAKSFKPDYMYAIDRDILTIGLKHLREGPRGYFEASASYSFASDARLPSLGSSRVRYKPIFSLSGKVGRSWRKWRVGALGEVHHSEGQKVIAEGGYFDGDSGYQNYYASYKREPFRLLVLGPEIGFGGKAFGVTAYYKAVMNPETGSLSDLADLMDRGAGTGGYGLTLSAGF